MKSIFYDHENTYAQGVADLIVESIECDLKDRGKALLLLPGGSSPVAVIEELSKRDVDWGRVIVTTTDERCVPQDSAQSNLQKIISIFQEHDVKINAVPLWDEHKKSIVPHDFSWPASAAFLGMGLDGHFASLFSMEDAEQQGRGIIATKAPSPPHERVSFPLSVFLEAKTLCLLVHGSDKWALCEDIIHNNKGKKPLSALFTLADSRLELHILNTDTKSG